MTFPDIGNDKDYFQSALRKILDTMCAYLLSVCYEIVVFHLLALGWFLGEVHEGSMQMMF